MGRDGKHSRDEEPASHFGGAEASGRSTGHLEHAFICGGLISRLIQDNFAEPLSDTGAVCEDVIVISRIG